MIVEISSLLESFGCLGSVTEWIGAEVGHGTIQQYEGSGRCWWILGFLLQLVAENKLDNK